MVVTMVTGVGNRISKKKALSLSLGICWSSRVSAVHWAERGRGRETLLKEKVCTCGSDKVCVWLIPLCKDRWVLTMCWYQPRTELTLTPSHHHYAHYTPSQPVLPLVFTLLYLLSNRLMVLIIIFMTSLAANMVMNIIIIAGCHGA